MKPIVYGHFCVTEMGMLHWKASFIMHTKEKRHFHVIMASSDSFFNLWLEKYIGSSRYNTYVLGHLSKDESLRYWQAKVANSLHLLKERNLKPPKFEDVFSACGGCIFLMNLYWEEYCEEGGIGLISKDPSNFSMVLQERRKLYAAFEPTRLPGNDPPKMMELLVTSEFGTVKYKTVCKQFGKSVVHSMIEYNLLHMRPTSWLSFDIPSHNEPLVTTETPAALLAMKSILKDSSKD